MNLFRLVWIGALTIATAGVALAAPPSADDPVPVDPRHTSIPSPGRTTTTPETVPPLTDEVPRLQLPTVEPPGPPPVFVDRKNAESISPGTLETTPPKGTPR